MLISSLYSYIVLSTATVVTLALRNKYKTMSYGSISPSESDSKPVAFCLMLFFTLLIGLRPIDPLSVAYQFGDTGNYYLDYLRFEGDPFEFNPNTQNLIWNNLFSFWIGNRLGMSNLFLIGDALYFGCTYLACRKWFPNNTLAAFATFLGAFSTISYSYNGVKAGIAGAIFLLGLAYYNKKVISILLVLISWGFHHSMQLPVAVYVLSMLFKNPKWYFYGWAFCALMAVGHISFFQNLFSSMTDESGAGYLTATEGSEYSHLTGFRPDFLLYSAAPIWVGYKIIIRKKIAVTNTYKTILNIYTATNGIWLLCMYASFTNRIAYLSWFMYPIVLIYPFLKEKIGENQYRTFANVMLCHLGFTLFMELIYYQFIK